MAHYSPNNPDYNADAHFIQFIFNGLFIGIIIIFISLLFLLFINKTVLIGLSALILGLIEFLFGYILNTYGTRPNIALESRGTDFYIFSAIFITYGLIILLNKKLFKQSDKNTKYKSVEKIDFYSE